MLWSRAVVWLSLSLFLFGGSAQETTILDGLIHATSIAGGSSTSSSAPSTPKSSSDLSTSTSLAHSPSTQSSSTTTAGRKSSNAESSSPQSTTATSGAPTTPTVFTAAGTFPTSVFKSYFNDPTATSAQVQPVVSDPVLHVVYPLSLTDPNTLPANDSIASHPLPPTANSSTLLSAALSQILTIVESTSVYTDDCAKCQAALAVGQFLALAAPAEVPTLGVTLCTQLGVMDAAGCSAEFGLTSEGNVISQVLQFAGVAGVDGQAICQIFAGLCPAPPPAPLNLTEWFATPKPNPLPLPKQPSGQRMKVLHLSDIHLDPRYATGTEANCTGALCCRTNAVNPESPLVPLLPAPRFGSFLCDTPYSLMLSAMEAIPFLTGTEQTGFDFAIYTGDLVSHDPFNELSRPYTTYAETVVFQLLKQLLGTGPVYPSLGNHDTNPTAQDAPSDLPDGLGTQFSWNYDHVAALWELEGWIDATSSAQAKAHYGAYSVQRQDGLRIMTLNTDFWYNQNIFNFIDVANPDNSGALRFLTDELQDAEDAGDRVWILGHVPPGSSGNAMTNPSNLFYQIIDRYSPHVIAGLFFGHTHQDDVEIFYTNNGTVMNDTTAQTVAWIGPSVTPVTNFNVGFRMYEIDSATFEVLDAYTWFSDVTAFPILDDTLSFGPTFELEYSTRETYGAGVTGWGLNDPLNATWWQRVSELMESNSTLVDAYNIFQTKSSALTPPCTGTCAASIICAIRSGSAPIAVANCS